MNLINVLAIIVAVLGILRAFVLFKGRKITFGWLVFWLVILLGIAVVSFTPWVADIISKPLGVERGIDLIVYLSILLLFYLVFRLLMKIEKAEHELTRVVRAVALRKK